MWLFTSPRAKRIIGPKNFLVGKESLFQHYRREADIRRKQII
jgi:hypothetical protein